MNLTTKNLTNINKVASEVHRKYVSGTHTGEYASKENIKGNLSLNGDEDYPVLGQGVYNETYNLWIGKQLKLRLDLVKHLVNCYEKELGDYYAQQIKQQILPLGDYHANC